MTAENLQPVTDKIEPTLLEEIISNCNVCEVLEKYSISEPATLEFKISTNNQQFLLARCFEPFESCPLSPPIHPPGRKCRHEVDCITKKVLR